MIQNTSRLWKNRWFKNMKIILFNLRLISEIIIKRLFLLKMWNIKPILCTICTLLRKKVKLLTLFDVFPFLKSSFHLSELVRIIHYIKHRIIHHVLHRVVLKFVYWSITKIPNYDIKEDVGNYKHYTNLSLLSDANLRPIRLRKDKFFASYDNEFSVFDKCYLYLCNQVMMSLFALTTKIINQRGITDILQPRSMNEMSTSGEISPNWKMSWLKRKQNFGTKNFWNHDWFYWLL